MTKTLDFDIVNTPLEGNNLIEASAGTGKTYAIEKIYLRLLLEKNLSVRNILVVTFTKNATAELKGRIRADINRAYTLLDSNNANNDENVLNILNKLKTQGISDQELKAHLRRAIIEFDEAAIFTIHGFCGRILNENAFESSIFFDTELLENQEDILQEVVDDFWRETFYSADSAILCAIAKAEKISPELIKELAEEVVKKPDMRICPEYVEFNQADLQKTFLKIKIEWKKIADEFFSIMLDKENKLSRTKANGYQSEDVKADIEKLNAFKLSGELMHLIKKYAKSTLDNNIIAANKKKGIIALRHTFFDLCEEFKILLKGFSLFIKYEIIRRIRDQKMLVAKKRELRVQSFDDILLDLRSALRDSSGKPDPNCSLAQIIRQKYKVALIDEFQDTDPVQYEIFSTLFAENDSIFFMIGDPKQSIYRFRGADIFAYLDAKKEGVNCYTLGKNFRTTPSLIAATDSFFKLDGSFVYDQIGYEGVKPGKKDDIEKLILKDEPDKPLVLCYKERFANKPLKKPFALKLICDETAREIVKLLNEGASGNAYFYDPSKKKKTRLKAGDIAVLVAKNAEAQKIYDALHEKGVPCVIQKTGNIFESQEAQEIYFVMKAIANPTSNRDLKTALTSSLIGLSPTEIDSLMKDARSERDGEFWMELFDFYGKIWNNEGFIKMFTEFLEPEEQIDGKEIPAHDKKKKNVKSNLLDFSNGERRLTNLLHLAEIIHKKEQEKKLGIKGILSWLNRAINNSKTSEEYEMRLEHDDDAVKIMTVHKSKGLEFSIVFCPFMWTSSFVKNSKIFTFHDEDNKEYLDIGSEKEENINMARKENLAELLRCLYVALTRSKFKTYLMFGDINKIEESSIAYLFNVSALEKKEQQQMIGNYLKNQGIKIDSDEFKEFILGLSDNIILKKELSNSPKSDFYRAKIPEIKELSCKTLKPVTVIAKNWGVMSYSSLTHSSGVHKKRQEDDAGANDEPILEYASNPENEKKILEKLPEDDYFKFPKGNKSGSCVHEILEKLDFSTVRNSGWREGLTNLIDNRLSAWGLLPGLRETDEYNQLLTQRRNQITNMLEAVLTKIISDVGRNFSLSLLRTSQYLPELNFYYPVRSLLHSEKLKYIFKNYAFEYVDVNANKSLMALETGRSSIQQGFMTGSIDLVFEYNDKYYLVDWKNSWLGAKYEDYNTTAIFRNMQEGGYTLQYHIYSVALHRFLSSRIPDYRENPMEGYKKYVGGALYIYLRGMNGKMSNQGCFFDKPSWKMIEKLDELF